MPTYPDPEVARTLRRHQVPFSVWLNAARQYADDDTFDADRPGDRGDRVREQQLNAEWSLAYRADLSPEEAVDGARAAIAFSEAEAASPEASEDAEPAPEEDPSDPEQGTEVTHPEPGAETAVGGTPGAEDPDLTAADEAGVPGEGELSRDNDVTLRSEAQPQDAGTDAADPEAEARQVEPDVTRPTPA